jgi:hypothetical protein
MGDSMSTDVSCKRRTTTNLMQGSIQKKAITRGRKNMFVGGFVNRRSYFLVHTKLRYETIVLKGLEDVCDIFSVFESFEACPWYLNSEKFEGYVGILLQQNIDREVSDRRKLSKIEPTLNLCTRIQD